MDHLFSVATCNRITWKVYKTHIGLDKSGYQVYIFLIFPQKHMLGVLIRSTSQYMFLWRNKKNINTFGLKKSTLSKAMMYLPPEKILYFFLSKLFVCSLVHTCPKI